MTAYVAASGDVVRIGLPSPVPTWAQSVASGAVRSFTSLASFGAPTWNAGVTPIIPGSGYRGTDPIGAVLSAYSGYYYDKTTKKIYFWGGGHGDSSVNAVVVLDLATLIFSLYNAPTETSAYPPNYITGANNYKYPSGLDMPGGFQLLSQLTNPVDQPYAASIKKPYAKHTYQGALRNKPGVDKEIHNFWSWYLRFNITTNTWATEYEQGYDYISQKVAVQASIQVPYNSSTGAAPLGDRIGKDQGLFQGTCAVYDDVTDKFFVTLCGGNDRDWFFRFNPVDLSVEKCFFPAVKCREAMAWFIVGRYVYGITSPYSVAYPTMQYTTGFRFNIDTEAIDYFTLTGSTISFTYGVLQESAPHWYDSNSGKVFGWNHNSGDKNGIYEMSLSALGTSGGSGTAGDPWLWPVTRNSATNAPSDVSYRYSLDVIPIPDWGVTVVMPHPTLPLFAFRT